MPIDSAEAPMMKCKEYSVTKDQVTYMHDKVSFSDAKNLKLYL